MTIVEFYDKAALGNLAGALLCAPERVILVGDSRKRMERSAERYRRILSARGIGTAISFRCVNRNRLGDIVSVLSEIALEHPDCIFDLTGGEELYLAAVGVVMERYAGRVQCHRFNFRNDMLIDCDADGNVAAAGCFDISASETVRMYGGEIVSGSPQRTENAESCFCDADGLWEVAKKNVRLWNAHCGTLGAICDLFGNGLTVSYDRRAAETELKRRGTRYVYAPQILSALQQRGLISGLSVGETVSFTFKNARVKRCMTVAGQVLELAVARRLCAQKTEDGAPLYHDVWVGAVVDWDGNESDEAVRTQNEIDVMAMKSAIPIFISCKNGAFGTEELYKLNTVAERFGGGYAKKVLVATAAETLGAKAKYLRARMEDMGIRYVENADGMSEQELNRILRSLWRN